MKTELTCTAESTAPFPQIMYHVEHVLPLVRVGAGKELHLTDTPDIW
jgi:hypothetical protein